MESSNPARRSSGVYDIAIDQRSFHSGDELRDNAAQPAGYGAPAAISSPAAAGWDAWTPQGGGPAFAPTPAPVAPKQPFWKTRKFIISQIILIPFTIALILIIVFPVVRAIVALVIKRTNLDIQSVIITQPVNGSFMLALQGFVFNTGIVAAKIMFTEVTKVSWVEDSNTQTELGSMMLQPLSASHKRATINQTDIMFNITDQAAFGRFSAHLITSQNFTWRLQSDNLHVRALKLPLYKGLRFDKPITLTGINNFQNNVTLLDLQLPADDPAGGIKFVAENEIINPSPISLDLGTVIFNLSYKGVPLGTGRGENVQIAPGSNNISLAGTLVPQTDPNNLALVSELFTNYLNSVPSPVIATGVSTIQADGSIISWLSQGLQVLSLTVPFKPQVPINPIQAISIGTLGLQFTEANPWAPTLQSNNVNATLKLPFGFSLAIDQIQNDFQIMTVNSTPVASFSTPVGAATSSIRVLSATDTEGLIDITIQDTGLVCPDAEHAALASYNAALTNSGPYEFLLVGTSRAVSNTSLGEITLSGIKVNVSTTLHGLQGLKGQTVIDSVDVTGGTTAGINLGIELAIFNPSNLNLATGDLTLQLARNGTLIGTTLLPNLTLAIGNNTVKASSIFDANSSPEGLQTLNDFVSKKDVDLQISGFDGSTKVASLAEALGSLRLDVVLPALKTNLLDTAALSILDTTGKENNISHVTVSLANPFTAPLKITKINSQVSAFGIMLGSIDQDVDFTSAPNSTTQSPQLDLNMNFDPDSLFTVTRALAVEAGLDVAPLDAIVSLGGLHYLTTTPEPSAPSKRQASLFRGFDLTKFVQTAFTKLKSDVQLTTDLTIGDYPTTLTFSQPGLPTKTDSSLDFILPILAAPIVQKIVGGSALGLDTVLIIDPQQNSFQTQLKGAITDAGPFDAVISFPAGLTIAWQGQPIGHVAMKDINITGDVGGDIDAEATFTVVDVGHLTDFTKALLTGESFDWEISGENLTVNALGISVPGIQFPSRTVTLKGFNGLQNGVTIKSFDLPANDPAGGIHLTIDATTANPSQVGIQLNSLGFTTSFGGIEIATVAASSVTLSPGQTSELSLVGRLIPQNSADGLTAVSTVFNNFVQGKDSGVVVNGASAGSPDVTWLNEGIKVLQVDTALPNQGKLNIIKSIDLNELSLDFSTEAPFAPVTGSKSTDAAFTLPFAFPIDITALEQTLTLGFDGSAFGQLAIPRGPSKTDVASRVIHLTFGNVPLQVSSDAHDTFEKFVEATTVGSTQTISLSGAANADALTAVGLLSLSNLEFSVDSQIAGLQGLNARPVTVANLDVNHGFPDFLLINVDSALFNPSNLTIGTGDVSFELQFQDQSIGTANLNNLVILPGNESYPIGVHFAPQGGAQAAGQTLLQNFLQGVDSQTAIHGSVQSTPIESLQLALSQISLSPVTIPGIHQNLLSSVSLSFPQNIVSTGVASTSFVLANPFTASINLLKLGATATFHNLTLGTISNLDISSNPIHANGHSSVTSSSLPLNFNLDPRTIIQLLLDTSQQTGVSLGPLVQLFQFVLDNPDFKPPVTTSVDTNQPTCVSGHQFDANGAILASLKGLKVDLGVEASVKLDDFPTDLTFAQNGVPANVDNTALFLIGAVAGPIAQHLVDDTILAFTSADISNISNGGFDLQLKGSLTNAGPLDALITFTEPLNVNWQGKDIATISLPPICAAADVGVPDYQSSATLTITDNTAFTEFATFLLHNPSFDWTISTPKLRLLALGTTFDNVALSKVVTFKAFNGLPGVTINNFQLPSDDPAGGIHIETDANIPSSAQIGIELGTVTFNSFFDGTLVGPLSANNLVLKSASVAQTHLSGRIVPQSGADLNKIGVLFSQFLNGQNTTLQTTGVSVQPPGTSGTVDWLSTAFQSLTLDVILPGEKLQVIKAIELNDLSVTIQTQDQAFAAPATSHNTVAQYANPFGFSLQVVQAAQHIILGSQGTQIAQLDIPQAPADGGVSTGNLVDLDIAFTNVPLKSLNNAAYATLFAGVTLQSSVELDLSGSADVIARTTIGDVPISGIPINVQSQLKGINSFGGTAQLGQVNVTGSGGNGGDQFIVAPLTTILNNPSNVSLQTVEVALPVVFNGVTIGRAAIDPFNLVPGSNVIATEFHYEPDDANNTVAQAFLSEFLQTADSIPLTIEGDSASTPFPSLQDALSGLKLGASLAGLNQPTFITSIDVFILLHSFTDNLVDVDFNVFNPLNADLVIEFVQSDSGLDGETFAQFSQAFDGFVVPPGQTVNSGRFPNVNLTQGLDASLGIVPAAILDVQAAVTVRIGQGGYQIPFLKLAQTSVPTTYTFSLDDVEAAKAAASAASASASASASKTDASSSAAGLSKSTEAAVSTKTDAATTDAPQPTTELPKPTGDTEKPTSNTNKPATDAASPPATVAHAVQSAPAPDTAAASTPAPAPSPPTADAHVKATPANSEPSAVNASAGTSS